jgi:hypothetical protein
MSACESQGRPIRVTGDANGDHKQCESGGQFLGGGMAVRVWQVFLAAGSDWVFERYHAGRASANDE